VPLSSGVIKVQNAKINHSPALFDIIEKTQSDTYTLNTDISSSPSSRSRWIAIKLGTAVEVD